MLMELRIQNYAIIDKLEVQLTPGFNVITGETGAGKSIIIDAVDLLLGGRADSDFIRGGEDRAVVEGVFRPPVNLIPEITPLLEAEGIEAGGELTFTREIRTNGRHVCRLNGSTVSLQFYRDIGSRLVDIHGQSEHLSLLRPKVHVFLLDSFAGLETQRRAFAGVVDQIAAVRAEIESLEQDEAAVARRIDMLKFQIEEIRAVQPRPGEEIELQDESARLDNAEQLAALTMEAAARLSSDDPRLSSAIDLFNQIAAALGRAARIDTRLADSALQAEALAEQAVDLHRVVRHYAESVELNPARLAEVEERLDAMNRLKRKYGGTLEAALAHAEAAERELETITSSEARMAALRTEEETLLRRLGDLGAALSKERSAAAQRLGAGIEQELADLRMEGARFSVAITQEEDAAGCYVGKKRLHFDHTGCDHIEFMIAANRGEPLRAMAKVASGGETARIMLALKGVLSRADRMPTLIFDEIDSGVGGRLGSMLGQKLWRLSATHQVLCVTHLAQLAGFADAHFKVAKSYRDERTVTGITLLNDKQRVEELAEMLGAETVSARQSAHDLLMLARQMKEGKGIQTALL